MKTIKKITFTIITLCLLSSCKYDISFNTTEGNGITTKEEREILGDFNKIKAGSGLDVFLTKGNENKVVVEADENLQEFIQVYNDGNELIVTVKGATRSNNGMNVYVTYQNIEALQATSGANISTQDDTLKAENLTLLSSSGADIDIDIFTKNLLLDSSSGSDIKVSGTTITLDAEASSGSDINAKNLQVVNCKAAVSSGADITVNVKKSLDVKASSGGRVNYYGEPKITAQKDKYTSSIRKM